MKGPSLAEVANWMDDMRGSMPEMAPWHYVTIQVCDPPVPPFPCQDGCVTEKITWALGVLKAPPNPDSLTALRVLVHLVHLVGDIHQPPHTGENYDHGGNGVQLSNRPCVEYGAPKPTACKLHTWWDTELVRQALGGNEETTAATVWAAKLGALPAADADDPNGWAVQSNGYARSQAYTFSGFACTVIHLPKTSDRSLSRVALRQRRVLRPGRFRAAPRIRFAASPAAHLCSSD